MIKNRYFLIRFISTLLMSIIFTLFNVFFVISLLNSTKQIIDKQVTQIIYTEFPSEGKNSFWIVTNYYELMFKDEQINTNIVMQQKSQNYDVLLDVNLADNEVVISSSLAKKIKASKGSLISFINPYNHQSNYYKCVGVIPDIQLTNSILDFNIIVLGYDEKYINFKSNNETLIINTKARTHDESVLASNIIVMQSILFKNLLIVSIILLVQGIIAYIIVETNNSFDKNSINSLKKRFSYGESLSKLRGKLILKRLLLITMLCLPIIFLLIIYKNLYMLILIIPIIFHEFYDIKKNISEYRILR